MAASADIQHSLTGELTADPDRVYEACVRAVAPLGKRAEIARAGMGAIIAIYSGSPRALSSRSPLVGVTISRAGDGRTRVEASIAKYVTVQSKILFFIPAGPKRLVGRAQYFLFLTNLEHELGALDPAGARIERSQPI